MKTLVLQVMALNIGAALWMAADGEGWLRCQPDGSSGAVNGLPYRSEVTPCARKARYAA